MKIALCYSGQPRNIRETFENHQENLLPSAEHEVDKFAHFWFDESEAGKNFSSEVASVGKWDAGVKEWVLENGGFTKVEFEKPRERNLHFLHGLLKPDTRMEGPIPATRLAIRRMISMFYSMEQSTTLMTQHEKENAFKYDLVFRLRTDSFFRVPGSQNAMSAGYAGAVSEDLWSQILTNPFGVYAALGNWRTIYLENRLDAVKVRGIKDQFALGDSDSMKRYTSVYSNFDWMIKEGAILNPECLLDFNAKINNIEIIDSKDLNMLLYRNAAAN